MGIYIAIGATVLWLAGGYVLTFYVYRRLMARDQKEAEQEFMAKVKELNKELSQEK